MNYRTIKELAELYEILDCSIYLSEEKYQEEEEIAYNGWDIMLDNELAQKINSEDLAQFISKLIKFRSKEISLIKPAIKSTLYIWFDDFPVRLSFNILSGENRELPFNCKINFVDSPYQILNEFIKEAYDYALRGNLHKIQFFEKGDPEFDEDYEIDLSKITINVWKITLPLVDQNWHIS